MMNDDELKELQNPDTWDWDNLVEVDRSDRKNRGVVVSVRFSREEFDQIAQRARAQDKYLSQYVRQQVLRSIGAGEQFGTSGTLPISMVINGVQVPIR